MPWRAAGSTWPARHSRRSARVASSGTSRRRSRSCGGLHFEGRSGDAMSDANGHASMGVMRESPLWPRHVIDDIQTKGQLGRYRMQGFSMHRKVTGFDDLTFVPCTLSRVPLEGYREKCETKTVLGTRF